MLSPALSQLLERARLRFGVEIEILDEKLRSVFPESGSELGRLARESATLRRGLLDVLAAGRPGEVDPDGARFRILPLRSGADTHHPSALLAVRHTRSSLPQDLEPWSEVARAAVEADLASTGTLDEERQRSRRVFAALHFLEFLVNARTADVLTESLVQAAAIWFDADARIYRRDLVGDYLLERALPGVQPAPSTVRLNSLWLTDLHAVRRLSPSSEWSAGFGAGELTLIPLAAAGESEWILAVLGPCPRDADGLFEVIGRVAGAQLERIQQKRRDDARERFEALSRRPNAATELIALSVVRDLADMTGAQSAALTINRAGRLRRLASIGPTGRDGSTSAAAPAASLLAAEQFVCTIPLGGHVSATLELRAAPERPFTADDALVTQSALAVMQTWLSGASARISEAPIDVFAGEEAAATFVARLEEELERAKRFDLRLSFIVIDIGLAADERRPASQLQAFLRRELRGSDLLGAMDERRIAAVLTHTDTAGLQIVVRRLRQRLAETAQAMNLSSVSLGRAVFSEECHSADALVSRALANAESITALN